MHCGLDWQCLRKSPRGAPQELSAWAVDTALAAHKAAAAKSAAAAAAGSGAGAGAGAGASEITMATIVENVLKS